MMYHYWKQNKNVIFAAIGLFIVSLTALLFFLNEDAKIHGPSLKASVVDSLSIEEGKEEKDRKEKEEEDRYRQAMGGQPGPFVVLTLEGAVHSMNGEYETMTSYSKEDVEGKPFFSMIHPDDLSRVIAAFGKVIAQKSPVSMVGPYRIQDAKGRYLLNIASFYPLMKGHDLEGIGVMVLDITRESVPEPREGDREEPREGSREGDNIRDEEHDNEKRLVVEKLAQVTP